MKDYREYLIEEVRLVVLRTLAEAPGYRSNSSMLQMILEQFGLSVSRDQLHTELAWLQEQGLVSAESIKTVQISTLTTRGLDVAAGKAHVPGVKRPGPGG